MDQFFNVSGQLLEGFGENCIIFIVTLLAAIPLGLIISMGSMSKFKPLKWLTKTFVWIIRGTPLMLQLFVVFYVPPLVSNGSVTFARMNAALIAFIINYAAYFSEIFRGGIESVPKGQYEAGQVLGMTKGQIFFKVVLFAGCKENYCTHGQRNYYSCKGYLAFKRYRHSGNSYESKGLLNAGTHLAAFLFGSILPRILRNSHIAFLIHREKARLLQGLRGKGYVFVKC